VDPRLEALVTSLLYEGYALYPYTLGATKNATPTPFGIVYPPSYAASSEGAFDHLRIDCALAEDGVGSLSAEVRFLQPAGERHQAMPRRVELTEPGVEHFELGAIRGRVRLAFRDGRARVCVHNETDFDQPDADRAEALRHSLLSTHVVLRVEGDRFISPLISPGENVNSWPVLASDKDDAVLGAAIVLPDHPQLSDKSRGDLFDATEIEEALLLHVHALSDGERREISEQDPAVREMIARAAAATGDDLFELHASMEPSNFLGELEMTVEDRTFVRGGKVVLRLGQDGDPHDAILDGRVATIERIYVDYDDRVHLGVTVDDDPGSDVMRSSGRYLFFKPEEVEIR
jgi:hypothetical protein